MNIQNRKGAQAAKPAHTAETYIFTPEETGTPEEFVKFTDFDQLRKELDGVRQIGATERAKLVKERDQLREQVAALLAAAKLFANSGWLVELPQRSQDIILAAIAAAEGRAQ